MKQDKQFIKAIRSENGSQLVETVVIYMLALALSTILMDQIEQANLPMQYYEQLASINEAHNSWNLNLIIGQ